VRGSINTKEWREKKGNLFNGFHCMSFVEALLSFVNKLRY
jgi:hypothetical protein